jgi:hypothetical protein
VADQSCPFWLIQSPPKDNSSEQLGLANNPAVIPAQAGIQRLAGIF